jgi:hypothetical protein
MTLLEILVATVLLALLAGVAYGSYTVTARWYQRCQSGFSSYLTHLKLARVLRRLIVAASPATQKNPKANFQGERTRLVFTTHAAGGELPKGYRTAVVEIRHDREEGLVAGTTPYYHLTDKVDRDQTRKLVFPGVRELSFSYLDGREWVSQFDAAKKGKLPGRVRVSLTLGGEGETTLAETMELAVPCSGLVPIVVGP